MCVCVCVRACVRACVCVCVCVHVYILYVSYIVCILYVHNLCTAIACNTFLFSAPSSDLSKQDEAVIHLMFNVILKWYNTR